MFYTLEVIRVITSVILIIVLTLYMLNADMKSNKVSDVLMFSLVSYFIFTVIYCLFYILVR